MVGGVIRIFSHGFHFHHTGETLRAVGSGHKFAPSRHGTVFSGGIVIGAGGDGESDIVEHTDLFTKVAIFFLVLVVILLVFQPCVGTGIDHVLERLKIHGVEHVAGVVVECKDGAVGIPAIADIPLLDLADGHHHTEVIVLAQADSLGDETLNGR